MILLLPCATKFCCFVDIVVIIAAARGEGEHGSGHHEDVSPEFHCFHFVCDLLSFGDTAYHVAVLDSGFCFLHACIEFAKAIREAYLESAAKVIVLSESCIITLKGDRFVMVILIEGHIGEEA